MDSVSPYCKRLNEKKPMKRKQDADGMQLYSSRMSTITPLHIITAQKIVHFIVQFSEGFKSNTFYIKYIGHNGVYVFSHKRINILFVQCGREPTMDITT
jgi:hypothetical protein